MVIGLVVGVLKTNMGSNFGECCVFSRRGLRVLIHPCPLWSCRASTGDAGQSDICVIGKLSMLKGYPSEMSKLREPSEDKDKTLLLPTQLSSLSLSVTPGSEPASLLR